MGKKTKVNDSRFSSNISQANSDKVNKVSTLAKQETIVAENDYVCCSRNDVLCGFQENCEVTD